VVSLRGPSRLWSRRCGTGEGGSGLFVGCCVTGCLGGRIRLPAQQPEQLAEATCPAACVVPCRDVFVNHRRSLWSAPCQSEPRRAEHGPPSPHTSSQLSSPTTAPPPPAHSPYACEQDSVVRAVCSPNPPALARRLSSPQGTKSPPWSTAVTSPSHCSAPSSDLPADRGVTHELRHSSPLKAWQRTSNSRPSEDYPPPHVPAMVLIIPAGARRRSKRKSPSLRTTMATSSNRSPSFKSNTPSSYIETPAYTKTGTAPLARS
jgi:hypothetical protein